MSERVAVTQCATCPWRVDCDPLRDIPNGYSVELHEALSGTIATPGALDFGPIRAMACHYSPIGEERACAGWLANQLGEGNNIPLRIAAMRGHLPMPITEGRQHQRFEDTLPTETRVQWA